MYEYVYEYGDSTLARLFFCLAPLPGNEHPHGIRQEPFALHRFLLQFRCRQLVAVPEGVLRS